MRFICHFERSAAESRNLPKLLIIQISPLRAAFNSPPVEMTKAQNLIIIGISDDFREEHADVFWRQMKDMRNFLIHEYFGVNTKVVWDTCKNDLPVLKQFISTIL